MTSEPQPVSSKKYETPTQKLYTLKELQVMALHATLNKMGVSDIRSFLDANEVKFISEFRIDMGMGITVLSITPKPPKPETELKLPPSPSQS